jgi:hypothetical protein
VIWKAGRKEPTLGRGRLLGAGFGLVVGGLSLYSDLLRGELRASYLSTVLVAVAILTSFQPWHILLLCGLFTGMAVAAGPFIRLLLGLTPVQMAASGQVVHLVLFYGSVSGTGQPAGGSV